MPSVIRVKATVTIYLSSSSTRDEILAKGRDALSSLNANLYMGQISPDTLMLRVSDLSPSNSSITFEASGDNNLIITIKCDNITSQGSNKTIEKLTLYFVKSYFTIRLFNISGSALIELMNSRVTTLLEYTIIGENNIIYPNNISKNKDNYRHYSKR